MHVTTPFLIAAAVFGQADAQPDEARVNEDYVALEVSKLRCVVGNNKALGDHAGRYNGLFSMHSPDQGKSPFVSAYGGFNLEHYFDARPRHPDSKVFFEPRAVPMTVRRVDDTTVELRQAETPHFGVESVTQFRVVDPHYVDVSFTCIPRKDDLEGGFLGVFWASYINGPINKSMYFLRSGSTLDKPEWIQFCTQHHDHFSTVLSEHDGHDLPFQEGPTVLFNQISPLRYAEPFFYGRFENMVLIYMFQRGPIIRFAHSPSGGGRSASGDDTNPAWDFQLIVPDYEVDQEYGYTARVVYKPWAGRADVLAEAGKFFEERP